MTSYLMRLEGGPLEGDHLSSDQPWPLPDEVVLEGQGVYRKVSESQLGDNVPHVMRGAVYRWEPLP